MSLVCLINGSAFYSDNDNYSFLFVLRRRELGGPFDVTISLLFFLRHNNVFVNGVGAHVLSWQTNVYFVLCLRFVYLIYLLCDAITEAEGGKAVATAAYAFSIQMEH